MSAEYRLPLLAKTDPFHTAARSVCDSWGCWATCYCNKCAIDIWK